MSRELVKLVNRAGLRLGQKDLALNMAEHLRGQFNVDWRSRKTLSLALDLSPRQISRIRHELVARGILRVLGHKVIKKIRLPKYQFDTAMLRKLKPLPSEMDLHDVLDIGDGFEVEDRSNGTFAKDISASFAKDISENVHQGVFSQNVHQRREPYFDPFSDNGDWERTYEP